MSATITERVQAGAEFLDEAEPGWWQHIDIERLDLGSPCRCVLGQLEIALDSMDPEDDAAFADAVYRYGVDDACALGFDAWDEIGHLTAAWRELIQARREAAS